MKNHQNIMTSEVPQQLKMHYKGHFMLKPSITLQGVALEVCLSG